MGQLRAEVPRNKVMARKPADLASEDDKFLKLLEDGVKKVLSDPASKPGERLQAVQAGAKLLAIRHKIGGGDEKGFFD